MKRKLEYLNWKPMWVSHLGCVKGCLDYLDMEVSEAWLFGGTGHAFIMNMHEQVCPSGPTAWKDEMLQTLGRNLGYTTDGVVGHTSMPGAEEIRERAWDLARRSIDEGIPCYGWELAVPEYYVINGYDETGYYFSGPMAGSAAGPKPWKELGVSDIGVIVMYAVRPGEKAKDAQTVENAIGFALEFARNPKEWVFPKYTTGIAAYDTWIRALESETANGFGMAYNSEVWQECRCAAVAFLKEAKERLGSSFEGVLDEAIGLYDVVARNLKRTEELFPFHTHKPSHIQDGQRRAAAIEWLKAARASEEKGLKALTHLHQELRRK